MNRIIPSARVLLVAGVALTAFGATTARAQDSTTAAAPAEAEKAETPAEDAKKIKAKKILFFKIFSILNVEQKKKLKFCSEREARAERL